MAAPFLAWGVTTSLHAGRTKVGSRATTGAASSVSTATPGWSRLPAGARHDIAADLAVSLRGYQVHHLSAVNAAQDLALRFSSDGVTLTSAGARVGLRLTSLGRAGNVEAVAPSIPTPDGASVSYAHPGGVVESYRNTPLGVDQAFTLDRRPAGKGPLVLDVATTPGTTARLDSRGLLLSNKQALLQYGSLSVTDAGGAPVPASLTTAGSTIAIHIDDAGSRYPLHVDPLVTQASDIVGTGASGAAFQGYSVAISADGNTVAVGGPYDNSDTGAVWIFTRSGTTWTQQGSKLVGTGAVGHAYQGLAVALSADGNTLAEGGAYNNSDAGAVWVFTRSGTTWSQQAELTGSGASGSAFQGTSVGLSADGNTLAEGGSQDNSLAGAVWVFSRSGSTWSQIGSKLTGSNNLDAEMGMSIAVSPDASTILAGGAVDDDSVGAAWVFTLSGSTWSQQGSKLTPPSYSGPDAYFGSTVALSTNGSTALVGAQSDNSGVGSAWVFVRSGSTWSAQTKLLATGESGGGHFGSSVALAGSGTEAVVGGYDDNSGPGAVWVFTESNGSWAQQGSKLTSGLSSGWYGYDSAVSADGGTLVSSAVLAGSDAGGVWIDVTPLITSPSSMSFGEQTVATSTPVQWIPVSDGGDSMLWFDSYAAISGADAADFSIPS
ncbi:MAG TPA: hypothetical protein VMD59_13495, partial [Acidimicrobiales bacterium]|nr:hypothetical protein [Acidimicrobiales bacterium]